MTFFQKQSFYRESKNPKPKKKAKKFFARKHASVRDGEKKKRGARFHGEEREKRQKGRSAQIDRQKRKHATDARRTTEEQRLYRDTRRFGQVVGEQQKRRGEEEEDEEDVYD